VDGFIVLCVAGAVLKCDVFRDAGGSSRVSDVKSILPVYECIFSSSTGNGVSGM
jgi:hypothetical protein